MATTKKIMIVNNTNQNIDLFHEAFVETATTGNLPAEISDIFTTNIIETADEIRVCVDFAED